MASKKILIQVDVTTKSAEVQINKVVDSMNKLEGTTAKLSSTTKKNSASAGLHNAILMESGRLASDLNYGFTAIANNLGQLFSLFQASADSAGGLTAAFGKLISIQALFLIGGQILIQNLDKIVKFFKETVFGVQDLDKVFNNASKTVEKINGNFELYISTLEDSTKSEEEKQIAIKKLNEEYPDYIQNLEKADVTLEDVKNKTEAATKQNNLYRDSILELAISRAAQNEIERISGEILQEEINLRKIQAEQGIESEEQLKQALIDKQAEIDAEQEKINLIIKQRAQSKSRFATDSAIDKTRLSSLKKEKQALEGNLKSYLGLGESANERIARLKEERDLYIEYVKLAAERNKEDEKTIENATKINEKIFEQIEKGNLKMINMQRTFAAKSIENEFARKDAELKARRDYLFDVITQSTALETEKEKARYEVNKFYSREIVKNQEAEAEARKSIILGIVSTYAKALGSLSQLLGKNTKAGKIAALAEIAAGTAVGFIQALDIAQKSAKGTGPAAALAFPVFYASQVAAVLGAAAQAKQVLESGRKTSASRPTAGTSTPSISTEAPDFNVVGAGGASQLAAGLAAVTGRPLKAFVVSKEISSAQELDRNITNNAQID